MSTEGFLASNEELAHAPDTERVVGRLGEPAHLHRVLVDHVLVRFGVALLVVHVPAERLEERVQELTPELGLVVTAGAVRLPVPVESFDEIEDFRGCGHAIGFWVDT